MDSSHNHASADAIDTARLIRRIFPVDDRKEA
jgi:hypothetical protein